MTAPRPTSWQRARRPEQIEARRHAILEAARDLFAEARYEEVSLGAISDLVGISKSNLYRYFESKEQIFLTLFERDVGRWAEDLEATLARCRKLDDAATFVRAWIKVLDRHPRLLALNALLASALERNVTVDAVAEFKSAVMSNVGRACVSVRRVLPSLDESRAFYLVRASHALAAGLWPMANPAPVMDQVLERPEFETIRVDFTQEMQRALLALVRGTLAT